MSQNFSQALTSGLLSIHEGLCSSFWHRGLDHDEDLPEKFPELPRTATREAKREHEKRKKELMRWDNLSLRKQIGMNQEHCTNMLKELNVTRMRGMVQIFCPYVLRKLFKSNGFSTVEIEQAKLNRKK